MPDLDSRNHFYLGREHDLASGQTAAEPLLYKSKDLTTHAVCVGMTGSGKTGLCVSLLEEAALDGVPAICIDPKGDLGNLLLGFPELRPADFRPWIDESVAARKGKSPDEYAADTAELWRNGLAGWGQGPERIEQYNDTVERLIFTPGASHGIPMTVLKSFDAPPAALRADADAFRQRVSSAVSGLLALLGIDADPVRSREHIFLSNVLTKAWTDGRDLSIADMIREIQSPPFNQIGVLDLDTFYPQKERNNLAMDLNNLLASPAFAGWMSGQPLDVDQLFYAPPGPDGVRKPRMSIVSIAHLDDAQRMFFVTILLNEVLAWIRTQPGTGSLRCLLYMDEVFGYFPPTANPPSKEPMLTLLKQARAFGLGCVLATQNPVDLDYKGLSNAGTWFLGRLQTERDKMRVMEGLEGASAQAGSTFDKRAMERTLAGVGSRVFLMNNVHDDQPRVFHTRWAMSYLAGPLSRDAIKELMDPVRDRFVAEEAEPKEQESNTETESNVDQEPTPPPESKAATIDPDKLKRASLELSKREGELVKSLLLMPIAFVQVLIKIVDLVVAKQQKRATARKQSSVMTAASKATGQLSKPSASWSKWRDAYAKHSALVSEGEGKPPRPPILPVKAWLVVAVEVVLAVVALAAIAWLASSLLAPAVDPDPITEQRSVGVAEDDAGSDSE